MQNHNNTIKTSDTVLRKIYLSLYWKGWVWEGVGDRTELQHSIGHNRVSFPFSWAAQPEDCSSTQHLLSYSSDPQLLIGGLEAPSARCWLSLPHLVTNWLNLLCTELYNSSSPTFFLWASQIALIQPIHGQGYTRPDAPVIYTGSFPILTARPGRRSIYNSCMYVRAGRPAFARQYVGVHWSTSLMSSSLLSQQCHSCLLRLTWIVFMMGGSWPQSWCLLG